MTQQQLSRMIEESGEAIDRLLDDLQVELAKYRRAYDRFERTGEPEMLASQGVPIRPEDYMRYVEALRILLGEKPPIGDSDDRELPR